MRTFRHLLFFLTAMYVGTAFAEDARFGEGTNVVQSFQAANATCFLYEKNAYKCACSNLKSQKKLYWFSHPAEYFNGKLSSGTVYIFAERCR